MDNDKIITITIALYLLDKLADIAKEYDTDSETLIAVAVKRLLDDIEFVRDLRSGQL